MSQPPDIDAASEAPRFEPSAGAGPRHEARLFGAFALVAPDGSTVTPGGRKARAALAYLLLAGGTPVSRERLCSLLWGDRGEEQARASLRQTLYEMRALSAGDAPLLVQERTQVQVPAARVDSDLARMRRLAAAGDPEALAVELATQSRELLSDLDGVAPDVDEWLAVERMRHGDERRRVMLDAAGAALGAAQPGAALRLATALLTFDATDERATRLAIEASERLGDRDSARQAFARLDKALRTEVGVAPSAETSALYQRVMSSPTAAAAPMPPAAPVMERGDSPPAGTEPGVALDAPVATVAPRRRAPWAIAAAFGALAIAAGASLWSHRSAVPVRRIILVEPLQVAAGDSNALALRNGLAADLARVLVGHDAALTVADSGDRAAAQGDADFVLTGEVQSAAGQLHAGIKLSGRKDAAILWSNTFTRPAAELDALREQMSAKIADVAGCALGGHHPAPDQLDLETMRLYLAACEQKHGDWLESVRLLKQVVARNPGFAHGWAMLAAGTATSADLLPANESEAAYRAADVAARRALALDPDDGEALYARSEALPGIAHWQERVALLEKGRAVDPDNGVVSSTLAWNYALAGRRREALAGARQAVDADPFSAFDVTFLAELVGLGGDPGQAVGLLDGARRRFPQVAAVARTDFRVAALAGDASRASAMLADGPHKFALAPASLPVWQAILAARSAPSAAHDDAAARVILAAAGHDPDIGLRTLERLLAVQRLDDAEAFAAHSSVVDADNNDQDILFSELMRPLRADPRFMALAARQGLVAIWSKTGRWPDFCGEKGLPYDCRQEAGPVDGAAHRGERREPLIAKRVRA